ncbi:hypothetical protein [Sphingomonas japonica]|nr:hypothetical protein [Sphingomonas japonica]
MERLFQNPSAASHAYDRSLTIASCVVNVSGKRASKLVGGPTTNDPSYSNLIRAMNSGRYPACIDAGELNGLSPRFLSSAIAERFLIDEGAAGGGVKAVNVNADSSNAFHGDLKGEVTIDNIGRCIAIYSPDLVRKVMETESGSAAESSALSTLYSQTPQCGLTGLPEGIPSTAQRMALVDGMYAWAHRDR